MFLIDDLLVKPFVSFLDILHQMAIEEMYDIEAIQSELKENQLLFEIGERDREEYEQRKEELERRLDLAERARENLSGRVEVKRG